MLEQNLPTATYVRICVLCEVDVCVQWALLHTKLRELKKDVRFIGISCYENNLQCIIVCLLRVHIKGGCCFNVS